MKEKSDYSSDKINEAILEVSALRMNSWQLQTACWAVVAALKYSALKGKSLS